MTQPASEESNSLVKKRGKGVGESSGVDVGAGVAVAGIGVREAGSVPVGKSGTTGVEIAGWQAVMRMRHPMRSFFMALFITQLSSIERWTMREEYSKRYKR